MTKWDLQLFLGLPTAKQDWPQVLVECLAEIFGTFIIVFFGCGSVLSPAVQDNDIVSNGVDNRVIYLTVMTRLSTQ